MIPSKFIHTSTIEEMKSSVKALYEQGKTVTVGIKKTRAKGENYDVLIEGVYSKFFTVREKKKNLRFTVQYVDVVTGEVTVKEAEEEHGV